MVSDSTRTAGAAPAMMFPPFPAVPAPHAAVPYYHGGAVPPPALDLQVQCVTAANYEAELDTIASLLPRYPIIAVDTEYPGIVHRAPDAPFREWYALVKANVDEVPIVQLGITLCDELGNIPVVSGGDGRTFERAWEVTFSDFDARRDRHAPESVAFLRSQGVDFDEARESGVSSVAFAAKLAAVLSSTPLRGELAWAAFGGAYDFGYMVKMLSGGRPLPETWHEFMSQATALLCGRVYDAKYMAEHCDRADLWGGGGLRSVAAILGVPRHFLEAPCRAGPKSYLASRIYTVMRRRVLYRDGGASYQGLIHGLQR